MAVFSIVVDLMVQDMLAIYVPVSAELASGQIAQSSLFDYDSTRVLRKSSAEAAAAVAARTVCFTPARMSAAVISGQQTAAVKARSSGSPEVDDLTHILCETLREVEQRPDSHHSSTDE
ncbi:uncharacterized protein V6R79_017004 [Siganus canaliculatus]